MHNSARAHRFRCCKNKIENRLVKFKRILAYMQNNNAKRAISEILLMSKTLIEGNEHVKSALHQLYSALSAIASQPTSATVVTSWLGNARRRRGFTHSSRRIRIQASAFCQAREIELPARASLGGSRKRIAQLFRRLPNSQVTSGRVHGYQ